MTGAALVAAIVVSLTAAWALGEALGYSHSLRERPRESPWFYGVYTGTAHRGRAAGLSRTMISSG